jgi:hypothetical protein
MNKKSCIAYLVRELDLLVHFNVGLSLKALKILIVFPNIKEKLEKWAQVKQVIRQATTPKI